MAERQPGGSHGRRDDRARDAQHSAADRHGRARQEKAGLAERSAMCDFGLFGLLGEIVDKSRAGESGLVIGLKVFLGSDDRRSARAGRRRPATLRWPSPGSTACGSPFTPRIAALVEDAEARLRAAGRVDALAHLESRPADGRGRRDRSCRPAAATRPAPRATSCTSPAPTDWRRSCAGARPASI